MSAKESLGWRVVVEGKYSRAACGMVRDCLFEASWCRADLV